MIDADFIQKIIDVSGDVKIQEINGRPFANREMFPIHRKDIEAIVIVSLQGMVDYINANENDDDGWFLNVQSPGLVKLLTGYDYAYKKRDTIVMACFESKFSDVVNVYKDQEMFLLDLNSYFVMTEQLEQLIRIVSNVKSEEIRIDDDDGISQQVTSRSGIARVENVKLPNPISLKPFRTFAEIEQPDDYFVFRARKARDGEPPCFGLFENGSGLWRIKAIESIKMYFWDKLPEMTVIG